MEIVVEETIVISFFLNYLILKITSRVTGQKGRLFWLTSLLSSVLDVFIPLWRLSAFLKICLMLCLGLIIILISFKYKSLKEYMLNLAIFVFATFLFGGGGFMLKQAFGSFPLFVVALSSGGIYIIACIILKIANHRKKIKNFTYKLTFKDGEKVIREEAYLDSGNVLYDALTNKPVVLVNFDVFHKFYEDVSLMSIVTKSFNSKEIKNGHYLKIKSAGKGTSILIFTVDELMVEGDEKKYKNVSLGLSFSGFEKSFGKNVLLHCDYS